jgi:hypothetical protein
MQKICQVLLASLVFLFACKQKNKALNGDAPVKVSDVVAAYLPVTLPYQVADTNVQKKSDTTTISYTVLSQFIPDSILTRFTGTQKDKSKIHIHPAGKIVMENGNYLLTNFTQNRKTTLAVFFFDKKNNFVTAIELLRSSYNDDHSHYVAINKEPTFTISKELLSKNELRYTRNGFALNEATGEFMKVINETNEDQKKANEILNPVDTLPRKNKLSGDYIEDKKNFISVRDGKSASHYVFFIHFEKNEGQCVGELKGELNLQGDKKATFRQNGDPCVIDFTFSSSDITVKEQGSCGNHRGMRCLFNDTYRKRKKK